MVRRGILASAVVGFVLAAFAFVAFEAYGGLVLPPDPHGPFLPDALTVVLWVLLAVVVRTFLFLWLRVLARLRGGPSDEVYGAYPTVSVVIPACNEEKLLSRALQSVLRQDYPISECVIVDDGSVDGTAAVVEGLAGRAGPTRLVVLRQPAGGKARALNLGFNVATSDLVLWLDADSVLASRAVSILVRPFRDAGVAAVGCNVRVANRGSLFGWFQRLELVVGQRPTRRARGLTRSANMLPGSAAMVRRALVRELGGFTADTACCACDLAFRLLRDGRRVLFEPRAVVATEVPGRLLDVLHQRYVWTRGLLQVLRRDQGSPAAAGTPWRSIALAWSTVFEGVLWPVANVLGLGFLVALTVLSGRVEYLIFWLAVLTILDMSEALQSVSLDDEDVLLVPLAIVYRVFFAPIVDVVKAAATLDDLLGLRRDWNQGERPGR